MRRLREPFVASVAVMLVLATGGALGVLLAWRGIEKHAMVAKQVPFLVSGSVAGLALIGFATGIALIQHRRLLEARRRANFDAVIEAANALVVVARSSRTGERS